jgi:D-methionine transport system substrate-binding protein
MKKLISLALALVLTLSLLALASCGKKDENTIVVGASSTPHAEILEVVVDDLAAQGYTLEIKIYDDYILPNTGVDDGALDANYFQHTPYLNSFNRDNGTDIVSAGLVHYEPFGMYAGKVSSIDALVEGSTVAIPNDGTNEARALYLLEAQGLIKLKEGVGFTATVLDIAENPLNLKIEELEAAQLVRALEDVDVAVINGNYAIQGGLKVSDALAVEDASSDSAQTYANILVVKEGNENVEKIQVLAKALQSETVRAFMEETYAGAVVPIF